MKYVIGLFAVFATTLAAAQTVTLSDGTQVRITVLDPSASEEAIVECSAESPTACKIGSVQYCTYSQDKQDREGGYTFETSTYLKSCDTNADGRYEYCFDYVPFLSGGYTFEDQTFMKFCDDNLEFNPIRGRVLPE